MMTKPITEAHVRRGANHSRGRQPLRLEIARRRKRASAGGEKFVTEVRFGEAAALFVPWSEELHGAPEVVLDPVPDHRVEPALA